MPRRWPRCACAWKRAGPLDGVYIANHGAMLTTEHQDPDGEIFAMVRRVVGPEVPVVATLDLHAKHLRTDGRHRST